MSKCSFCGCVMAPGTGKIFIKNDSSVAYFCSNKCEKNSLKLKRIPRYVRWTEEYRKTKKV